MMASGEASPCFRLSSWSAPQRAALADRLQPARAARSRSTCSPAAVGSRTVLLDRHSLTWRLLRLGSYTVAASPVASGRWRRWSEPSPPNLVRLEL